MPGTISEEVLTIATLGRPFHLGMLYDCRKDKIIPGITLWDKSTLEEKSVQQLETADFEIIASDTFEDKASALDVNIGLKLSFLGGLIEVSGSGKYLDNRKSSNHQERVTLKYKCTTRSEEMTMEQLGKGKIQHPDVFDHDTATHVVTGITYGGHAFFVFDRTLSSSSADKEVHGHLHAMIHSIPGIKIDGHGDLDLSEKEKNDAKHFNCRYFGDFLPKENPSSFEDAVRLYKDIPKFLGKNGENAVPVKVQLYPLTLLDSKACRLVRDISTHLVSATENVLEDLYELNVKSNDLIQSPAVQRFRGIQEKIKKFKSLLTTYKLGFQKELSLLLPHIRGGGKEEAELTDLLKRKESSPFGHHALTHWIQCKERQVKILSEYTSTLSMVKFASEPGDLQSLVMSPNNSHILCFSILMPVSNQHLIQMAKHIKKEKYLNDTDITEDATKIPLKNADDECTMMEKARHFRGFVQANKDSSNTAFIVAEESSESCEFQAMIRYYKDGHLTHQDFEIPTAPGKPISVDEQITHNSIFVKWDAPSHGMSNVSQYKISCDKLNETSRPIALYTNSTTNIISITDLEPGSTYCVSVQSVCEAGVSSSSEPSKAIKTKPSSPPGKAEVWQISNAKIGIKWSKPSAIGPQCAIKKYVIKEQQEGYDAWNEITSLPDGELAATLKVKANVTYKFKVYCDCGPAGNSLDSEPSEDFVIKLSPKECLHSKLLENSKVLQSENLVIYQPIMREVTFSDDAKIRKYELGSQMQVVPEKVIMVVGATGSGKSTLINGLINYIFDVGWNDDFRFKLIDEIGSQNQAKSQTSHISSYTIHHQKGFRIPYTLTIIDTPGFGDVSGIERDKEITQQIRSFFTAPGFSGIDHLDAVGFVAQSSLPRLTPTQRYIFDQILSLFGKDIAENIFMLLTFADGQKPQVLSGINEAKMPYKKFFKFNNSALYACKSQLEDIHPESEDDDDDGVGNFDAMFWQMGEKSFKIFLKELNVTESKSLQLTKDVLNERNQIEVNIIGIRMDIQTGLNKLEQLKKEVEILTNHQADIDRNKDFKYTVTEEIFEKVSIPAGQYITNCLQCNRTCHENCGIRDDAKKAGCWAITNQYCRICPSKCYWDLHKNFPYKFVSKQVEVTKTAEDLRQRYQEATEKKLSAENLISRVQDEFQAVQLKVLGMTEIVRKCLERLKEIALKPNPLSTTEYIDILIESEKAQADPGWQSRCEQLQTVRKEAEYMKKLADRGFDPFKEYMAKIRIEEKANKRGPWVKAKQYISKIFT